VPIDVKRRLDWLKRRIAKEFELEFTRQINTKLISSPIEQIFLLEWKFASLDSKLKVKLCPHERIATDGGSYEVDFLIVPDDQSLDRVKVAIELDGHDFHEKNKDQVRKDKARERAIVQQGVTVLRFSGSEVVRNARACVEEVAKFLSRKPVKA
jgi:very-short-patch-repair endonuclease